MKKIDLKQIKSMEELKKELGNKYDEIMYRMNLELLDRMDKAVEELKKDNCLKSNLLEILLGSDKE